MKKRITQWIVGSSLLLGTGAQASLVFNLDSYNATSGAVTFSIAGTVDRLSEDFTWSNDEIFIADTGIDWVFSGLGANPIGNPVTPNIIPHNSNDNSHYYAVDSASVLTAGEDSMRIRFDNDFSIGEAVNFTWSGSINPIYADFSQLTANPTVLVGGRIDAIPEPSVIALVGIFGGGLFGVRRIFMI